MTSDEATVGSSSPDSNPADNSTTPLSSGVLGDKTSADPHRKVIFIRGMPSASSCGGEFPDWLVDTLATRWVEKEIGGNLRDDPTRRDFLYFSYSGEYCEGGEPGNKCSGAQCNVGDYRWPSYPKEDTCVGTFDAADKLHEMLGKIVQEHTDRRVDSLSP